MSLQVPNDRGLGIIPPQTPWQRFRRWHIDNWILPCIVRLHQIETSSHGERSWTESTEHGCCKLYLIFCQCLCCGCDNNQNERQQSTMITDQEPASVINLSTTQDSEIQNQNDIEGDKNLNP
ncbi:MAG: hypothetical protein WAM28_01785 [Chlamydiales bacterium]